tara:strand:- start:107 stop:826 length:720 start_codon:yes stop_codon:yes gene_type:complete
MSSSNNSLSHLETGTISECVPMLSGSNNAFQVTIVDSADQICYGIYKPQRGERPLWDFPDGSLYKRERAAYLLSLVAQWEFIPKTVIRHGPYGIGSVQQMIAFQSSRGYFDLDSAHIDQLWPIAIFDLVTNNADRKGGHCLLDASGKVWSIDHGLTFHSDFKVRTVIWDFWGEDIPQNFLQQLENLRLSLSGNSKELRELETLINPDELLALRQRVDSIIELGRHPLLDVYRNVPWPPY